MGMGTPRKKSRSERTVASKVRWLDGWSEVATPAAESGRQAGNECTNEQRDKEPQRGIGRSLARLVSRIARRGFRVTQLCLHARICLAHALLRFLLCQTGALRYQLTDIPNVFRRAVLPSEWCSRRCAPLQSATRWRLGPERLLQRRQTRLQMCSRPFGTTNQRSSPSVHHHCQTSLARNRRRQHRPRWRPWRRPQPRRHQPAVHR